MKGTVSRRPRLNSVIRGDVCLSRSLPSLTSCAAAVDCGGLLGSTVQESLPNLINVPSGNLANLVK